MSCDDLPHATTVNSGLAEGTIRGCSFIMSYRLGVGGVSQSMTHYDREGGSGKTNYDV